MKTFKLFLVLCIGLSFAQCKTMKLTDKAPFKISGATYHSWIGGQPGVKGTNLIIGLENDSNIEYSVVYFQNKKSIPSFETRKGKRYLVININNSSNDSDKIIKEVKSTNKEKTSKIPFVLSNNEAVIGYIYNGKTFYYKVSKIKKTETIFYP